MNDGKNKKINRIFKHEKTFIAFGSRKMDPFIKGYVKTPLSKFYRTLCRKANCVVFLTPEYRTTILCSTCGHRLVIPKSPHRFASCNACKTVWNRDINAARNIFDVGFQMYEAGTVPERFTYSQHVYLR